MAKKDLFWCIVGSCAFFLFVKFMLHLAYWYNFGKWLPMFPLW